MSQKKIGYLQQVILFIWPNSKFVLSFCINFQDKWIEVYFA